MAKKKKRTRTAGRDARDGKFVSPATTKRRPSTTVREQIPVAGRGAHGAKCPLCEEPAVYPPLAELTRRYVTRIVQLHGYSVRNASKALGIKPVELMIHIGPRCPVKNGSAVCGEPRERGRVTCRRHAEAMAP